jgi:hypothetical protein
VNMSFAERWLSSRHVIVVTDTHTIKEVGLGVFCAVRAENI